nr:unnamed protein product [Callosobruchus analis]
MEWNQGNFLKLIKLVEKEPVIWNPGYGANTTLINQAWARILVKKNFMRYSAKELKTRWDLLLKKYKFCLKTRNTLWFAFEAMNSFLGAIYQNEQALRTEVSQDLREQLNIRGVNKQPNPRPNLIMQYANVKQHFDNRG